MGDQPVTAVLDKEDQTDVDDLAFFGEADQSDEDDNMAVFGDHSDADDLPLFDEGDQSDVETNQEDKEGENKKEDSTLDLRYDLLIDDHKVRLLG